MGNVSEIRANQRHMLRAKKRHVCRPSFRKNRNVEKRGFKRIVYRSKSFMTA